MKQFVTEGETISEAHSIKEALQAAFKSEYHFTVESTPKPRAVELTSEEEKKFGTSVKTEGDFIFSVMMERRSGLPRLTNQNIYNASIAMNYFVQGFRAGQTKSGSIE